jgi:hypothetical protein
MSYILDALKKSDQERQRGTVPSLHTLQVPLAGESQRRSRWIFVLALALLLNAGLLVWWLRPWQPGPPKTVGRSASNQEFAGNGKGTARDPADAHQLASPSVPETTQESRGKNQASPKHFSAIAQSPPAAGSQRSVGAARETRQEPVKAEATARAANRMVPKDEAKAGRGNPAARPRSDQGTEHSVGEPPKKAGSARQKTDTGQNSIQEQKPDGQERTITRLTVPPDIQNMPESPGSSARHDSSSLQREPSEKTLSPGASAHAAPGVPKATPGTQPSAAHGRSDAPPSSPAAADQGLPEARELPLPIQRELPSISVSMVIYSDKPGDRMININGRMMREGQEVSPGLKVEQITPNGAILKFQSHRFRKGVL